MFRSRDFAILSLSDMSLHVQKYTKTSKNKQLYTQFLQRCYLELNCILLTFVRVRKHCRHQCGLPVAAIDHRNPAVLCMSKTRSRQITMPKITISSLMFTILAERNTIGITEMLVGTHTLEAIPTTFRLTLSHMTSIRGSNEF